MTEPTEPATVPPSALSWVFGPAYVLGLAAAGVVVAVVTGPVAGALQGEPTLDAPAVFLLVGAVTLLGTPLSLLAGRGQAEPALVFGATFVGIALFSGLAVEQPTTMQVILPLLGGSVGMAPGLLSVERQRPLLLTWLVAESVGWIGAQLTLLVAGLL